MTHLQTIPTYCDDCWTSRPAFYNTQSGRYTCRVCHNLRVKVDTAVAAESAKLAKPAKKSCKVAAKKPCKVPFRASTDIDDLIVEPDDDLVVVNVDPMKYAITCDYCHNKPYIVIEINGHPKVLCDECLDKVPALRHLEP